jgi:hypothetical protein
VEHSSVTALAFPDLRSPGPVPGGDAGPFREAIFYYGAPPRGADVARLVTERAIEAVRAMLAAQSCRPPPTMRAPAMLAA